MRISDWSSDVCSSDLRHPLPPAPPAGGGEPRRRQRRARGVGRRSAPPRRGGERRQVALPRADEPRAAHALERHPRLLGDDRAPDHGAGLAALRRLRTGHPPPRPAPADPEDRKSVGEGKSVSVRVVLGGRRTIKKTNEKKKKKATYNYN